MVPEHGFILVGMTRASQKTPEPFSSSSSSLAPSPGRQTPVGIQPCPLKILAMCLQSCQYEEPQLLVCFQLHYKTSWAYLGQAISTKLGFEFWL